ncbi:hypothetical protein pb186bvf_020660 [Paramecium bursaria]
MLLVDSNQKIGNKKYIFKQFINLKEYFCFRLVSPSIYFISTLSIHPSKLVDRIKISDVMVQFSYTQITSPQSDQSHYDVSNLQFMNLFVFLLFSSQPDQQLQGFCLQIPLIFFQ